MEHCALFVCWDSVWEVGDLGESENRLLDNNLRSDTTMMPWMEHCALCVHQDSVWKVGDPGVLEISMGDNSSREHSV